MHSSKNIYFSFSPPKHTNVKYLKVFNFLKFVFFPLLLCLNDKITNYLNYTHTLPLPAYKVLKKKFLFLFFYFEVTIDDHSTFLSLPLPHSRRHFTFKFRLKLKI